MAVHALVGRLVDRVEVVDVADSLEIGEDAGADHEGEEVHCNQDCGAGTEGYQQPRRVLIISLQLYLHHGNLGKSCKKHVNICNILFTLQVDEVSACHWVTEGLLNQTASVRNTINMAAMFILMYVCT